MATYVLSTVRQGTIQLAIQYSYWFLQKKKKNGFFCNKIDTTLSVDLSIMIEQKTLERQKEID
jgi:hypothetical protein